MDEEEKKQRKLVEIIMSKGDVGIATFNFNEEDRERFFKDFDLWDMVKEMDDKEIKAWIETDKVKADALNDEIRQLRQDLCSKCREILVQQGVDVEKVCGKEKSWDELREELAAQLEGIGISRENAEKAGLLDEDIITEGVEGTFTLDDTPEMRKRLKENDIEYTAKNGKITLNMRMEAKQGVSFKDTRENRKILDDNEVQYIEYAQGHYLNPWESKCLFVPYNWMNSYDKGYNTKLGGLIVRGGKVAAAGTLLGPGGAVLMLTYYGLKKGLRDNKLPYLSYGEKKALANGLTVFKDTKDRNGRPVKVYIHQEGKKYISVDAHDVRIPDRVRGVVLTPIEKQKLRQGQLLELEDNAGRRFAVRIDISRPNSLREYVIENKRDKTMKEAPQASASDKEKLEWIARYGAEGISQIFGEKRNNLKRDTFLDKYEMRVMYGQYRASKGMENSTQDETRKQGIRESISEADQAIKDIAEGELAKMSRKMGR